MSWIDDAQKKVADGLVALANQGSVPAANAVLKLLAEERQRESASTQAGRLAELRGDPSALCRYLGEAGMNDDQAKIIVGRNLESEERAALTAGRLERAAEIRHVELQRVRDGAGKIDDWMR